MNRTLITILFAAGCTATVRSAPPAEPMPPPPPAPAPAPAPAPMPPPPPPQGQHPAYLHALTDLRAARGYLQRPAGVVVKWDEKKAINEIDLTINEIKQASIDDGKNIDEHPAVDVPTWGGRLDRALELLEKARGDANEAENNPAAQTLKTQVLKHITIAEEFVREGQADAKTGPDVGPKPGAHPAWNTAQSNLRQARALLERPAGAADVKWDEKVSIADIDEALRMIHAAKIDDGAPVTEHQPIESTLVYHDRLREALKLLGDAAKDIEEREDNTWAKGARHGAVEHVRHAEKAVREAISDRKDDKAERKEEKREEHAAKKGH